jgi:hypothetical protein
MKNIEKLLLETARLMVTGELSYFDGARKMLDLKPYVSIKNITEDDFSAFKIIYSETDHIPSQALRKYMRDENLSNLEIDLKKTEAWAKLFAYEACLNLISKVEAQ